jgi:hypothetical protein
MPVIPGRFRKINHPDPPLPEGAVGDQVDPALVTSGDRVRVISAARSGRRLTLIRIVTL